MKKNIPYGRQHISKQDIESVCETLTSPFLTQGPKVKEFEDNLASYCHVKHCISVNSATSALHIACIALGVKPGDTVWTSPISFVASSNCALYCNANIDFVDIDPETGNLSAQQLLKKLELTKPEQLPKVLIVVHLSGNPCELKKIHEVCKKKNIFIIEDASHAIGAKYKGTPIGSCKYSDITVFSFHPVKIITTAEGGALTTQCSVLSKKLLSLRSHGITKDQSEFTQKTDEPWYYEQQSLGFNYRITDLQCSLGITQLARINEFIRRRNEIAEIYNNAFSSLNFNIETPHIAEGNYSSFHLYIIKVDPQVRLELFKYLKLKSINVNVHYIPIYKQPYYKNLGFQAQYLKNAELFYQKIISLPMFPSLSEEEIKYVINQVAGFYSKRTT